MPHLCGNAADRTKVLQFFADHNAGGVLWKAGDYDKNCRSIGIRRIGCSASILHQRSYYGALCRSHSIERDVAPIPTAELRRSAHGEFKSELVNNFGDLQPVR